MKKTIFIPLSSFSITFGLIFLATLGTFTGCYDPDLTHRLDMPSYVNPVEGTADLRVPGTVLFLKPAFGVAGDSATGMVSYKGHAIKTYVLPIGHLTDSIFIARKYLESLWRTNRERFFWNSTFQFSDCPANIFYYSPLQGGKDSIAIFWDNGIFSALELAGFEREDLAMRDSLLHVMLSAYLKTDLPDTISGNLPFNLDLEGTTFLFAGASGEGYFYTVGGTPPGPGKDYFVIMEPRFTRPLDFRKRMAELVSLYARNSIIISDYDVHEVSVMGGHGYKLEGKCVYKREDGKVYFLMVGKQGNPLILSAFLYQDMGQRMSDIVRISNSLTYKSMLGR